MTKPVLAIDIDDVIMPHESLLVEQLKKHVKPDYRKSSMYEFDWQPITDKERRTIITTMESYLTSEEFFGIKPAEEAVITIEKLKSQYKLVIATARLSLMHKKTEAWLKLHFPDVFDRVGFVEVHEWGQAPSLTKIQILEDLQADVLIDDNLKHVTNAASVGMRGILFGSYPWNQANDLPKGVTRAKDWKEVEEILL